MTKIFATSPAWQCKQLENIKVWYAGEPYYLEKMAKAVSQSNFDSIKHILNQEYGGFAYIFETDNFILSITDRVESYKVYIHQNTEDVEVHTDARVWLQKRRSNEFDEKEKKLYLMTGYCTGQKTLYKSAKRVLPGQYALINKANNQVTYNRYYTYQPDFSGQNNTQIWEKKLDEAFNNAIERTIKKANGNTIWLALSAGYDSRLILGKLLQFGYKKIQTFSYGTPGNMESRVAKDLAENVNVPWRFIPPKNKNEITDYWHGQGAEYLLYAAGLSTTPAITEFYPIKYLKETGEVSPEDVFTNGQTGDFLTGGHIPIAEDINQKHITSYILQKHFSLLKSLHQGFDEQHLENYLQDWQKQYCQKFKHCNQKDIISKYLTFEWQERQCGYVINQQRVYDFLNLKWSLPLWDSDLMDLYSEIPINLQKKQNLYLKYLQNWNYRNLFDQLRLPYNPWPKYRFLIYTLANLGYVFGGTKAKEYIYKRLYYYTDYHYMYKLYGKKCYNTFMNELRNPISIQVLDYITRIKHKLKIDLTDDLEKKFIPFSRIY